MDFLSPAVLHSSHVIGLQGRFPACVPFVELRGKVFRQILRRAVPQLHFHRYIPTVGEFTRNMASAATPASSTKKRRVQSKKAPAAASTSESSEPEITHWLVKAEPAEYPITEFEQDGVTEWDGVRNYQARNNLRRMKLGQKVLFYESNPRKGDRPGVVGLCHVVKEDYPDPT